MACSHTQKVNRVQLNKINHDLGLTASQYENRSIKDVSSIEEKKRRRQEFAAAVDGILIKMEYK